MTVASLSILSYESGIEVEGDVNIEGLMLMLMLKDQRMEIENTGFAQ